MKVVQQLDLQRPWWRPVCRDMHCLRHGSYCPIRGFCQASCNWRVEGLFGQSFSIAPPIQALRGPPCLGSFSVPCVRHIEGPPWMESYSVDWWIKHLKGHPGWGPTLQFSASGISWASLSIFQLIMLASPGREAMVMAPPPTYDSAVSPYFHGCPVFLHSIFYHNFLPHIPSIHLSTVNSSTCPGIVPQSLNSSSQLLFSSRLASLSGVCIAAARIV